MTKSNTMRKGRIEFYDDVTGKQPRRPPCSTFTLYRGPSVGLDNSILSDGGFYVMVGCDSGSVDAFGPIATLARAEHIAAHIAEEHGYRFIPDNGVIAQVEREYE
jgi:hypothetical protein